MAEFTITSEVQPTQSNLKSIFEFLIDFKNFKDLMPDDKVDDFVCDADGCSFTIRGVTPLKVKLKEQVPYSKIIFESEGLAKFNFLLEVSLVGSPELLGDCQIQLHGDMNPFIKVMAEKPLTNLVNTMSVKLSNLKV